MIWYQRRRKSGAKSNTCADQRFKDLWQIITPLM